MVRPSVGGFLVKQTRTHGMVIDGWLVVGGEVWAWKILKARNHGGQGKREKLGKADGKVRQADFLEVCQVSTEISVCQTSPIRILCHCRSHQPTKRPNLPL